MVRKKNALKLMMIFFFLSSFLSFNCGAFAKVKSIPVKRVAGNSVFTANIDCASKKGKINDNVFGVFTNPDEVTKSFNLLSDARFRLIETLVPADDRLFSKSNSIGSLRFIKIAEDHIERAIELGIEPMLWFNNPPQPFKDLDGFRTYTQSMLKYLTKGKQGGHNYKIRMFRFGNEPDNPMYWNGTKDEFFKAFAVWAKAVKNVDPNFIVVGPGLVFGNAVIADRASGRFSISSSEASSWAKDFLNYCNKYNVPVDYFTVHGYSPVVYPLFNDQISTIKRNLEKYPNMSPLYGTPKVGNDEWNVMVGDQWSGRYNLEFDTTDLASNNILALINMVKSGLELSIRYGGTDFPGHDYSMVFNNYEPKPVYYAFKGFNMLQDTPYILKDSAAGKNLNAAVLAGISGDNKKITVVAANFDVDFYMNTYVTKRKGDTAAIPKQMKNYDQALTDLSISSPTTYGKLSLTLENFPWSSGEQISYKIYSVDDAHNLEVIESNTISGSTTVKIERDITLPSVQVIVFEKK
ncbi:MAG: hypothetical protein HZA77_12360 [Candidatus Schekmanbacteria bacterium]|nr:hypothetical protein [Candidatus Schekmanbacteria bacterium]